MKRSVFGAVLAAAVFGMLLASPAAAKTAKECRAEWSAHKAEYKAKGITEKAYVATCRAEAKKEKATEKKEEKEEQRGEEGDEERESRREKGCQENQGREQD